ncbi:hypothetical protein Tco_1247316 [Tanacetum coccineum]
MELFVNQDRQASQVNLTNFEYMQNINTSHTMHNSQYPPNTQLSENVQYQNSQYQQNSFPNQNTQYQDNSFPNHTQYQQDPFPYHNSPFFQSLRPSGNYHVSSNAQYTQNIQCSQYIEYPVNEKNTNLNIGSSQNYNKHVDDDEDDDDDQEGGGDDEQEKIGYNSDIDGDDFDEFEESVDEHKIGNEYLTEKQQQQLDLDEEALRETLEEEARAEKEWEERIRQERAHDELFRLEFGVKSDSEYESD